MMLDGLANALPMFQFFLSEVFCDMLLRYIIVYRDYIVVYSSSLWKHVSHVRAMLARLHL